MTQNEKIVIAASAVVVIAVPTIAFIKVVKGKVNAKLAEKTETILADEHAPLA